MKTAAEAEPEGTRRLYFVGCLRRLDSRDGAVKLVLHRLPLLTVRMSLTHSSTRGME